MSFVTTGGIGRERSTSRTGCFGRFGRSGRLITLATAAVIVAGSLSGVSASAATVSPNAGTPTTKAARATAERQARAAERQARVAERSAREQERMAVRTARQQRRADVKAAGQAATAARRASRTNRMNRTNQTAVTAKSIAPEVAGVAIVAPSAPPTPLPSPTPAGPLDSVRLQDALTRWTAAHPEVGTMTVAIRVNGRTWAGSASASSAPPPDPADRYRVMSITKTITAALVLRAVESGRLTLDGPLPILTGVDAALPPGLTVRHLLRHQSGFVDYTSAPGFRPDESITPRRAVELTLRAGFVSAPGSTTAYTNSNYLYLGLLLEQIDGRPYADLVTGLVSPLGMLSTRVDPPNRPGWAGFASGGVMSTVSDVALWGEALLTPRRVLSDASLREMTSFGADRAGLGVWGYCPCSGSSGPDRFDAIGHHTAAGGMFVFGSNRTVLVMRAEATEGDTAERARTLAEELHVAMGS